MHSNKKKINFFFFPVTGEACEYLREIGGLGFINDLAKSSAHGIVKEAALFTLGIIIESNGNKHYFVYFQVGRDDVILCFVPIFFHQKSCYRITS